MTFLELCQALTKRVGLDLRCILEQTTESAILQEEVQGITSDSREVHPGFIFVPIVGTHQNGYSFLQEARTHGARICFLGEPLCEERPPGWTYFVFPVESRFLLSVLASVFYGNPSQELRMIGVTGTSGKTTTSYVIESILKAWGWSVGLIGTIEIRYGDVLLPAQLTTPGPVELQKLLLQMKQAGCQAVVMEVSSHALKQRRVDGIAWDGMVFTNLSPEHLDFHLTMEDYFESKKLFFTRCAALSAQFGKKPFAVVNGDEVYGQQLTQENLTSIFLNWKTYHSQGLESQVTGIKGVCAGVQVQSALMGAFNASNIAAAIAVGQALEVPHEVMSRGILQLTEVPGRLEKVSFTAAVHVWVDYAHKPDALEKVLKMLRTLCVNQKLITVFGCGGDRDRQKRPQMGQIALKWSDFVYITSDNPRTEDPKVILEEIAAGISSQDRHYQIEIDRRKAIRLAIQSAQPGDFVLIAGKGHETYQCIGTEKWPFDDRQVAREALKEVVQ